jgi:phosphoglycerol transferase MdoB-like AlkP superfamily enzyme
MYARVLGRFHIARARAWVLLTRTRFLVWAAIVAIVCSTSVLTRLVLLVMLMQASGGAEPTRALAALAVGIAYDMLVALWLGLPMALLLLLVRDRWARRPWARRALAAVPFLALAGALFVVVAEVLFFDEFQGRFNFVAVDYLIYPTEVQTSLRESYPVPWLLAAIVGAAALAAWPLCRRVASALAAPVPARTRAALVAGQGAMLAVFVVALSPAAARVSADRALNEVASNGYYTFWLALAGQDAPYDGLYRTNSRAVVLRRLPRLLGEPSHVSPGASASSLRLVTPSGPQRRLNVVVVLEESFGSAFVGTLHLGTGITPRFDSLAAEGTLLTNVYSTGNRTIRALEATTASIPPLPGVSIVRRPRSLDLFTLPSVLRARGYSTAFIYGGRALFDHMGAYMRANGMERVVEQRDFPAGTFATAWGVADEAIFDRALAELDSLDATGKPFYVQVLTVSNHKPYAVPPGRVAPGELPRSRENAVRYADWALGRFMRDARAHRFFDHTIFVLMGDHGARVYGASEIPLASYEVPVLLYAPGIVPAGVRLGTLASTMDVPPTVLGILGEPYVSRFFGQDVLYAAPADGRALMTHNSALALMRGGRMAVLDVRGVTRLYGVDSAGAALVPERVLDDADRALLDDAVTYFQAADLLYREDRYWMVPQPAATPTGEVSTRPCGGCGDAGSGGAGSVTRKTLPRAPERASVSAPPCSSATRRAIASPRPAPAGSVDPLLARKKRSKTRDCSSAGMPGPVSATSTT